MPYDTATVEQVDDNRVRVVFTGPDVKEDHEEYPVGSDVEAGARSKLATLNTVVGKPKYSKGQVLDLTPPAQTTAELARQELSAADAAMTYLKHLIDLGVRTDQDADVTAARERFAAALSAKG